MPEPDSTTPVASRSGGITPVFRVRSLSASIDYYESVLGFKVDWQDAGNFASVSRDRCGVFLCDRDQRGFGTQVWIGLGDTELLFEEYRAKRAKVWHPPTNYP